MRERFLDSLKIPLDSGNIFTVTMRFMYNRLFAKILDSSIWLQPSTTRIVWITLLAAMDQDGYAHFSAIENLATRARVTVAQARMAVECFLSPDPDSGNPANDGRRIERVPGGYMVLNAEEHRKTISREIQREQTRLRVAKYRAKMAGVTKLVTPMLPSVIPVSDNTSEFEGECEGKHKSFKPPTEKDLELYSAKIGLPLHEATKFFDYHEARGWRFKNGPMKSWQAAMRTWKTNLQTYGKPNGTFGSKPNPRLEGVCRGPTDYAAAYKRKLAKQDLELEMVKAQNKPRPETPQT